MAKATPTAAPIVRLSNADLWNEIRGRFPSFESITSEGTKEFFNERTFEELQRDNVNILNDFFQLSMRVYFNLITVARAKDTLENRGFGETYDQPWGAYTQRMSISTIQPVSPAFRNLQNYSSPDPFVVKKPELNERFYVQNFDYQSLVTVPDSFQFKTIFVAEYGMSETMSAIFTALQNGYTIQKFEAKLEALNTYLNSTQFPLQETQYMDVSLDPANLPTSDETVLRDFILSIMNIVSAMDLGPASTAFNQAGFLTTVDRSRLVFLVRPGVANAIAALLLANTYNIAQLDLPVDFIEVPHFGGLQPVDPADGTTPVYPVYDPLGTVIGYSATQGSATAEFGLYDISYIDPNANVLGIIADRGLLFETIQNPYEVEPIRNPRGKYTNYWANSAGNGIHVDRYYPAVVIRTTAVAPTPTP